MKALRTDSKFAINILVKTICVIRFKMTPFSILSQHFPRQSYLVLSKQGRTPIELSAKLGFMHFGSVRKIDERVISEVEEIYTILTS